MTNGKTFSEEELPQFLYLLGRIKRHLERLEQE